jgi:competence protein ComEC
VKRETPLPSPAATPTSSQAEGVPAVPAAAAPAAAAAAVTQLRTKILNRRRLATESRPLDDDFATQEPALVHFINIGQGNAVLFQFPCGTMLIDTGGEADSFFPSVSRLTDYLDEVLPGAPGTKKEVDLLVLTHPHIDHTRGAEQIISRFKVKHVIDNSQRRTGLGGNEQNALRRWANEHAVPHEGIKTASIPRPAGLTSAVIDPISSCDSGSVDPVITALWGQAQQSTGSFGSPNNHSLTLRVDYGSFSVLVTGDLQKPAIRDLIDSVQESSAVLDVDVYEAGHHGSHNATTHELVELMSPKIAVVSMGDPNRTGQPGDFIAHEFGHPNHLALEALLDEAHGVSCFRSPVRVPVGIKGRHPTTHAPPVFEEWEIAGAVFATGWDGTVVVRALPSGAFTVRTQKFHQEPTDQDLTCQ